MANKLWFRAKRYGWGWYPLTWQGWLILVMYVFGLLGFAIEARQNIKTGNLTINFWINYVVLTSLLIAICYLKGEHPHWRWGDK